MRTLAKHPKQQSSLCEHELNHVVSPNFLNTASSVFKPSFQSVLVCMGSSEQLCVHIGEPFSPAPHHYWPCLVSCIKHYNDFLPDMKGWRGQLNGVIFFPCNHSKTRRVKNVNIELPHSTWYDGFGISAAAIHFL